MIQQRKNNGSRSHTHSAKSNVSNINKQSLTESQAKLVERMQRIHFGRIKGLVVSNGEPVLAPPTFCEKDIKPGADNSPRPEAAKADFTLKAEVIVLFAQMEAMGNGTIECIEIKYGLPFKITIKEVIA